jgi:hypothetical protein
MSSTAPIEYVSDATKTIIARKSGRRFRNQHQSLPRLRARLIYCFARLTHEISVSLPA